MEEPAFRPASVRKFEWALARARATEPKGVHSEKCNAALKGPLFHGTTSRPFPSLAGVRVFGRGGVFFVFVTVFVDGAVFFLGDAKIGVQGIERGGR